MPEHLKYGSTTLWTEASASVAIRGEKDLNGRTHVIEALGDISTNLFRSSKRDNRSYTVVADLLVQGAVSGNALRVLKQTWENAHPSLGGLQDWLAHDMQTERFYHRTVVAVVLALSRLAAWSELRVIDGFSGSSGGAALAGARRLSFTTSGRSQGYALTLLLGVLVMAAWLLVARP
jgi:NADH:ubiquinone oxidoreductase subunit 5 (subunit L)/multisubunit Na+/H+ antiporter MnhA subunit